ncbi:MAG: ABC transporter ATP-binding protein [Halobacteriales archaeon]|nr:ABC transporter ATP-binding protein [Halobacteriales archaeon]
MTNIESEDISWREKFEALVRVARYKPKFAAFIIVLGGMVAFLEGVGLSFLWPIIEVARAEDPIAQADGFLGIFLQVYQFLGIPFTLEFLIAGISGVMVVRFTMSFFVSWLQTILNNRYKRDMRSNAFDKALDAEIGYFDQEGSDDILNAIITETNYSAAVITGGVQVMKTLFLLLVYLSVMLYIAPVMAIGALALLGTITFVLRYVVEPAYTYGIRVAMANQNVQRAVQAGTQGIREVKTFGLSDEVYDDFWDAQQTHTTWNIRLGRNNAAISNFYDLAAALVLFGLVYVGFVFTGLSIGALGIFLLAMFRLSPLVSRLNSKVYSLEGNISHLVRTQDFFDELEERKETSGSRSVSDVNRIEFDDVRFSYNEDEQVLRGISFDMEREDFIAFVGQSGAGKSTVVSLLARMYDPDEGEIRADGVPIEEYDLEEWRSRLAVVRQNPFIFNDTLERNVTIGNRDASREEVERVCEIAKVNEFLDDLPKGYESDLGDDGVRLSGGQRQRVALARALLKDADFLILDEATSDLDSSLEKEVQASIEAMDRDYGIIAIAHRLSTVKNADTIYTLDDGEIIEEGSHKELLEDEGEYAELYAIQSKG